MIGVWPLIMGITMWLQQKLNPQPTDPVQAKIFGIMPIAFTFILAPFPAGAGDQFVAPLAGILPRYASEAHRISINLQAVVQAAHRQLAQGIHPKLLGHFCSCFHKFCSND